MIVKFNGRIVAEGRVTGVQTGVNVHPLKNPTSKFHAHRLVHQPENFTWGDGNGTGGQGKLTRIYIQGQKDIVIGGDVNSIEVQAQS